MLGLVLQRRLRKSFDELEKVKALPHSAYSPDATPFHYGPVPRSGTFGMDAVKLKRHVRTF
ncbi:hypothetical protein KIN20_033307 [Parelaphostrongylus tenuis]|uniref:Uncharacterized protein n=1 Tax=Parelaphostrongylus tenuis TaxID=148309 RepID=A0AAD5R896_PARTN|nr:hypothetical protein KIN20_033307 [Parelaphostrongylus tenuis]